MPHASYPGCEIVHVHSNVCTADILQIHLLLAGTLRAILYPYHSLCLVCFAVCRHTSKHHSPGFRLYQNSGMLFAFFSSLLLTRNVLCAGSVCATLLFHTIPVYGYVMFQVPVFSCWEFMLLQNKAAFNSLLLFACANKGELLRGIAHHSSFKRAASYLHTCQIMSEYQNW